MIQQKKIPILFENKADCCGCGACLNICPKNAIFMEEDEYGFLYPKIDEIICIGCGSCKKVCAFQNEKVENNPIDTYAAVAYDTEILKESASGGVFAVTAKKVISEGGVVFGAVLQNDFSVKHEKVVNISDICKTQGSKYTQSNIVQTFKEAYDELKQGKMVLYSGTPCQIMGLYGYLGGGSDKLFTIDIICHGVPNNRMFQDYIKNLENKNSGKITEFVFRDKSIGWGINGIAKITQLDGKKKKLKVWQSASSYLSYFIKGWTYRENCYVCPYACSHRPADITIGDFWGIEKKHANYLGKNGWDEEKGVSVIVVNTMKGNQLLKMLDGIIELRPSDFEQASRENAQLVKPSNPGKRKEILEIYKQGGWKKIEERFNQNVGWRKYSSQLKSYIPKLLKKKLKQL